MKKPKTAVAKNGVSVDLEMEVLESGRHVRFEADDPGQPGKKLTYMATVGAEDGPLPSALLAMSDTELDAHMQLRVDQEAVKFADIVESRRRVAQSLVKVT